MAVLGEVGKTIGGMEGAQVAPTYTLAGTVTRGASVAFARVYAYGAETQTLVDVTVSDPASGAFSMALLSDAPVTIIVTDDAQEYNAQVFDRVVPL
jgi:hypothetical protein